MKRFFVLHTLVFAISAFGVPENLKLIRPSAVENERVNGKPMLKVTYSLNCRFAQVTKIVLLSDNSGDYSVAVGVVYSADERNCPKGPTKAFVERVDLRKQGLHPESTFEPMDADVYSEKLKAYVGPRLKKRAGFKSGEKLIGEVTRQEMVANPETLECLGYPSWEGNTKAIGVCLVEAVDASTNGKALRTKFAVVISDDTEHPNESRQWSVTQVSFELLN